MEISNIKAERASEEEGVTVEIRNRAGELEEGVTITVVGTYSATYRKVRDANRDKMVKQRRGMLNGEALDAQAIETAARCIKGWTGFTANGQPYPYTRENAIALLSEADWIREQVEEAMNDHASFFQKS